MIGWHRKGFGLFWSWKIRHGKRGRPTVPALGCLAAAEPCRPLQYAVFAFAIAAARVPRHATAPLGSTPPLLTSDDLIGTDGWNPAPPSV